MQKSSMNENWYFWKDKQDNQKALINLPHDAMILEDRSPDAPAGGASGFFPGGKYWYAKRFIGLSTWLFSSGVGRVER